MRKPYQHTTPEEKEEIRTYLAQGRTHEWIAYKLCCSPITIGGIFREMTGSSKELLQDAVKLLKVPASPIQDRRCTALIQRIEAYLELKKKRSRSVQIVMEAGKIKEGKEDAS